MEAKAFSSLPFRPPCSCPVTAADGISCRTSKCRGEGFQLHALPSCHCDSLAIGCQSELRPVVQPLLAPLTIFCVKVWRVSVASRGNQEARPLQCVLVTVPAERCPSCAMWIARHAWSHVHSSLPTPRKSEICQTCVFHRPLSHHTCPRTWAPSGVHRQTEAQREGPRRSVSRKPGPVTVTCYCHQSTSCSHHVCPHVMLGKFILKQIRR